MNNYPNFQRVVQNSLKKQKRLKKIKMPLWYRMTEDFDKPARQTAMGIKSAQNFLPNLAERIAKTEMAKKAYRFVRPKLEKFFR